MNRARSCAGSGKSGTWSRTTFLFLVQNRWAGRNAPGFRLDTRSFIRADPGGTGERKPQASTFGRKIQHPMGFFCGEVPRQRMGNMPHSPHDPRHVSLGREKHFALPERRTGDMAGGSRGSSWPGIQKVALRVGGTPRDGLAAPGPALYTTVRAASHLRFAPRRRGPYPSDALPKSTSC
jgi:hypothetical protein